MFKKSLILAVVALGMSSVAFASGDTFVPPPQFTPGIYIGLQGGYSLADWNSIDTSETVFKVKNHQDFGGRAYVGYDFTKYFAIEAGYTQFFNTPELTAIVPTTPATVTVQPGTWDTYAVDLVARVNAPINDDFGLFAKAGGDYISLDTGIDGSSHSSYNALFGAGLYYHFTPNLGVDFSWTRYNGSDKFNSDYIPTYDLFAAGISWKFNWPTFT